MSWQVVRALLPGRQYWMKAKSAKTAPYPRGPVLLVQQSSRLLTLPAELRNMVYEYVFDDDETVSTSEDNGRIRIRSGREYFRPLLTCRQIRYEATPMAWKSRTFHLGSRRASSINLKRCGLTPFVTKYLHRVHLSVNLEDSWEQVGRTFRLAFLPLDELYLSLQYSDSLASKVDIHFRLQTFFLSVFSENLKFTSNMWALTRDWQSKDWRVTNQQRLDELFANVRAKKVVFSGTESGTYSEFFMWCIWSVLMLDHERNVDVLVTVWNQKRAQGWRLAHEEKVILLAGNLWKGSYDGIWEPNGPNRMRHRKHIQLQQMTSRRENEAA